MLLAHITDLHVSTPGSELDAFAATAERLAAAVSHINALDPRPDAVLATGDLVDAGSIAEYERLRGILSGLQMPIYLVPGNHDDRNHLRTVFAHFDYLPRSGFIQYRVVVGPLQIIALDTHVPGKPGGLLCKERLDWLAAILEGDAHRPAVIIQHHPPFATGIRKMDAMGLQGAAELEAIIAQFDHVERILCGHLHRPITARFGGTIAQVVPSTAHQIALDLSDPGDLSVVFEPPAFALHHWSERALITHLGYVGNYGDVVVVG